MYGTAADHEHREHVGAHRVADHEEPRRPDAAAGDEAAVRPDVLLAHHLDALDVAVEAAAVELALVQIALGDHDHAVGPSQRGQRLLDAGQELHRPAE